MGNFIDAEIIPGDRIGEYYLGCNFEKLENNLHESYNIEERVNSYVVTTSMFKFWIDSDTNCISQISVCNGFKGKFLNVIGIGSTLEDIERNFGTWEHDLDVYTIPQYPGICFELLDEEEWDEMKSPIEFITIYI
jgi:hypothetical protein